VLQILNQNGGKDIRHLRLPTQYLHTLNTSKHILLKLLKLILVTLPLTTDITNLPGAHGFAYK
jgi:hypothetical protein